MEDEQYAVIYGYLEHVTYPAGLTKLKIFVLRIYRSYRNYKLFKDKLFYKYVGKYVEAVPLKDESAVSVARGIYKVYCRQGAPVHIISDQGKEFVNQVAIYNSYIFMSMHAWLCTYDIHM